MESLNDHPIGRVLLKKLMIIFLKELVHIIRKVALPARCRRCAHFLGAMLYPLMVCCIVLLLAIAGKEVYALFYAGMGAPATATMAKEITVTLGNGYVVPIRTLPVAGASYIYLDTDSILYALKTKEGIDCNEVTGLNVPAGFPPVLTRLSEGTLVHLNAGSSLQWPACFAADKRQVALQGEAYFEVAPDAQRIFTVRTPQLTVKAMGTSFNVHSYADDDKSFVSLLEGSALITSKGKEKGLAPGQTAILDHHSGQLSTAPFDKRLVLAWRKGMYFFAGEPLANICPTASRMYGVKIIIDGKQAGNKCFSGFINRQQPLQVFLSYIKDTGGVDHYYDSKGCLHLK